MYPKYVNSVIMPSDAIVTPRLAYMYHRYLVSSELMDITPLSFNTGDFQLGVEYGMNNDIINLRSLLLDNMGGLQEDTSMWCIDEMCDHILRISEYLREYLCSLNPYSSYSYCRIQDWSNRSIWMSILPRYQTISTSYY